MISECPNYENPLCGLSNIRAQFEEGAFVRGGQYYNIGLFQNGLALSEVIVSLAVSQDTDARGRAELGCIACGKCLTVMRDLDDVHFVERHADLEFRH
jgi:hypothetical protein